MAATVTGTFRLIDAASPVLDRIERKAGAADRRLKELGRTMDRVTGANTDRKLNSTARQIDDIGDNSLTSAAKVKALEHELDALKRQSAAARLAQMGLGKDMDSTSRKASTLKGRLAETGAALMGLGKIIGLAKLPLLGVGIGVAIQAVSALSAGVVALTPRLADLVGVAGAAPATFLGLGVAVGSARFALSGLSDAMKGNKKAIEALTPAGRKFVDTLKGYQPVIKGLRAEAQKGLFPGLREALQQMRQAVPLASRMMRSGGAAVGGQAAEWADFLTMPSRMRDIGAMSTQGLQVFERMSRGVRNLTSALIDMAVSARPFTNWLTNMVLGWTKFAAESSRARRESGAWERFFDRTRSSMTNLGHILRNLWGTFRNLGRASRTLGNDLYGSMEKTTARWERWTGSMRGQNVLRKWFEDAREPLHAMFRLVGALGRAIVNIDMGGFTKTADRLTGMVGSLQTIFERLAGSGGEVVRLFRLLADMLVNMGPAVGVFTTFLTALNNILSVVNQLIRNVPGLGRIFAAALTFAAAYKMYQAVMRIGMAWGFVAKNATAAAAAQGMATGATGAGAVAAAGAARGRGLMGAYETYGIQRALGDSRLGAGRTALGGVGRGVMGFVRPVMGFGAALGALQGTSGQGLGGLALNTISGATFGLVPGATQMRGVGPVGGGLSGAAGGALGGAALGTMIGGPGIGTIVGAVGGAIAGGIAGIFGGSKANPQQFTKKIEDLQQGWARTARTIPNLHRQVDQLRRVRAEVMAAEGLTDTERKALTTAINSEIEARKQSTAELIHERNQRRIDAAREQGGRIAQAFQYTLRKGGAGDAFAFLRGEVGRRFRPGDTRRENIAQLQAPLAQAYAYARRHPGFMDQYRALASRAEDLFTQRTGGRITVVGGRVRNVGWNRAGANAAALNDPLEKQRQKYNKGLTAAQQVMVAQLVVMGLDEARARGVVLQSERKPGAVTRAMQAAGQARRQPGVAAYRAGMAAFGWLNPLSPIGLPNAGPHVPMPRGYNPNAPNGVFGFGNFGAPPGAAGRGRPTVTPIPAIKKVQDAVRNVGATVKRVMPDMAKVTNTHQDKIRDSYNRTGKRVEDLDRTITRRSGNMLRTTRTSFRAIFTEMSTWLRKINGTGTGGPPGTGLGSLAGVGVGAAYGRRLAGGGRIPGTGLADTVPIAPGTLAAPGELVVNRHTENRVDRKLRLFGTTLGREVGSETRPHGAPIPNERAAYGTRLALGGIVALGRALQRQGYAVSEHPAFGGVHPVHVPGSYHYRGQALDVNADNMPGGEAVNLDRLYGRLRGMAGIVELLWRVKGHFDHLHVAMAGKGALGALGALIEHTMKKRQAGGTGMYRRVGQAAINRLTRAAQAQLNAASGGPAGKGVMTFNQVARLAESVGLPGVTFAQIAQGESGFNPRAVGHDPGGTRGLGLWQITTGYNDDIIARFGGERAMFRPRINALAAKAIYDRQGISAWYGTRYMTGPDLHYTGRALGGRVAFGGWHGQGGEFSVARPTLLGVGESGRERVKITPEGRGRAGGTGGIQIHIGKIENHREGDVVRIIHKEFSKLEAELNLTAGDD